MRYLMSLFGRLLFGLAGLFDACWRSIIEGLWGVRMPPALDPIDADVVADYLVAQADVVDDRDVQELRVKVAAAKARCAALTLAPEPVVLPSEPAPELKAETWYPVVAPNGTTTSFARGTSEEAEQYWQLGDDGFHVEPVSERFYGR